MAKSKKNKRRAEARFSSRLSNLSVNSFKGFSIRGSAHASAQVLNQQDLSSVGKTSVVQEEEFGDGENDLIRKMATREGTQSQPLPKEVHVTFANQDMKPTKYPVDDFDAETFSNPNRIPLGSNARVLGVRCGDEIGDGDAAWKLGTPEVEVSVASPPPEAEPPERGVPSIFDLYTSAPPPPSPHSLAAGNMAPATPADRSDTSHANGAAIGPHPSYIQVAESFIFEQKIQQCLAAIRSNEAREDNMRLQGVAWIDSVRKSLQLPVKTFNTAVVYYHKFRLVHADNEYNYIDAAAAALFAACKIEDTLKKSREILCAAYNLKMPLSDYLSPDDPTFEGPSKTIVGIERLMLEANGFDFRNRHPQPVVMKLMKACQLPSDPVGKTAYNMSCDLYRTFAPLKQTTVTLATACIELSSRLFDGDLSLITGDEALDYIKQTTSRAEVMETMLDLLDLYTHHRNSSIVGPQHPIDSFINMRITLNKEASAANLPRHTEWTAAKDAAANGTSNGTGTNTKPSPATPADDRRSSKTVSPASPAPMGPSTATGARSRVGERGRDGTVRFMLSAERARSEKDCVAGYFKEEWEEYEEEIEVPLSAPRSVRRDDRGDRERR